jgi:diguanylate cyclase (GGDEF)-like protein/PAS domain S-box-containing protein
MNHGSAKGAQQSRPDIDSSEQLRLANMVATSILAGEPFIAVARRALDEVCELIAACRVSFWLRTGRDVNSVVHSVSSVDFPPIPNGTVLEMSRKLRSLPTSAHVYVICDIAATRAEVLAEQAGAGDALSAEAREAMLMTLDYVGALGARAFVSVPLVKSGKAFGAVSLGSPVPREWRDGEIALLEAVADALALARLKERAEERREAAVARSQLIASIASAIAAGRGAEDVTRRALTGAITLVPGARASFWLPVASGVFRAVCSVAPGDGMDLTGREVQVPAAHVRRSRHITVMPDCTDDPAHAELAAMLWPLDIRALIQVPVMRNRRAYGCLSLDAPHALEWSEDDVAVLRELAATLASALVKDRAEHRRHEAEAALRAREQQLRLITDNASDLIAMVDNQGRRLYTSPSYRHLFGPDVLAPGSDSFAQIHPDDRANVVRIFQQTVETGVGRRAQFRFLTRDGKVRYIESHGSAIRNAAGTIDRVVLISRDVTDRLDAEERLRYLAHHDLLTGLPNRGVALDRLGHAQAMAKHLGTQVAVLFVDLDDFKTVNDTLGHDEGDHLLRTVSRRLTESVRSSDFVARHGGDEFLIVLEGVRTREEIERVAQNILAALALPVMLGTRERSISCSIGIACYPNDGNDAATLLKKADAAMYQAKAAGKNEHRFYERHLDAGVRHRADVWCELELALERGEFQLRYQPRGDCEAGSITGVAAQISWNHPRKGLIGAAEVLTQAREVGLSAAVSEWVVREACAAALRLHEAGVHVPVMVDSSGMNLRDRHFGAGIERILRECAMQPYWLELELSELTFAQLYSSQWACEALRDLGIPLVLARYGSGGSRLTELQRIGVKRVEIDPALVGSLPGAEHEGALVRAIVAMCAPLHIAVTATGVESQAQEAALRAAGCCDMQGPRLSAPLDLSAMLGLVSRSVHRERAARSA